MTSPDAAPGYARESPLAIVNRRIQNRGLSERLLMDLTASGYHIIRATPDAGGAVTISRHSAEIAVAVMNLKREFGHIADAAAEIEAAIAASGGRHDGE